MKLGAFFPGTATARRSDRALKRATRREQERFEAVVWLEEGAQAEVLGSVDQPDEPETAFSAIGRGG